MVVLLITKINSEDVVIEPQKIDEAPIKIISKSKDLLSKRKQQEIEKGHKLEAHVPIETLPVDSENEFPLDFEKGKALLENRDAEIGNQSKGIKRFVPNNYSIFIPLLQGKHNNPTSVKDLKRKTKSNRTKIKAKKRKRHIFDTSKTDREELLSDLIELKPALNELVDEQNYKSHDILESFDQNPYKECAKHNRLNLTGLTENVLSEEGEEEEVMSLKNQTSNKSQVSKNERGLSYKGDIRESQLSSLSYSLSNQENTNNTTLSNEPKTQTVKREFINIISKNTDENGSKASTDDSKQVNADDIKFCLPFRPNKTEPNTQSGDSLGLVKKGTTKDNCESILLDISQGKKPLGQPEDELSSKGKSNLYSLVTGQPLTNPIDLKIKNDLSGNRQVFPNIVSTLSCMNPITGKLSTD